MASFEASPRDHLVTSGGMVNLSYLPGRIQLLGLNTVASVVCIAEVGDQLLVCLPNSVWDRKKDHRHLPGSSFKKGIAVSVAAVAPDFREVVVEPTLKVWIGLLSTEAERFFDFSGDGLVDKSFAGDGDMELLPYGESLIAVAAEHFTFLSAEEGLGGTQQEEVPLESRVDRMESTLASIQLALEKLSSPVPPRTRPGALRHRGGESLGASPKKSAKQKVSFDGLDRSVVDAALNAGIEPEHLTEMAGFLRAQPRRMEDVPRPQGARRSQELSESEESSEEEEEEETPGQGSSGDGGVAKAIVKLTKMCSALADSRKKTKSDNIEALLDQSNVGHGADVSGLGSGRKNSQALRALRRCLLENPEYIYKSFLHEQFGQGSPWVKPQLQAGSRAVPEFKTIRPM